MAGAVASCSDFTDCNMVDGVVMSCLVAAAACMLARLLGSHQKVTRNLTSGISKCVGYDHKVIKEVTKK